MFNIHLITNPTFDKNTYQFERKKQTVDNKLKQITKQKELESKESKKIKINFHNSFVNKETHQKYDKLIQTNKQRNIIKQEKKLNKDDKDDKEDKDDKGKVMPNQEKLKPAHAERKENTIIHDSINTTNNISEVLLIESVSILKNKNFSQINDSNYDNTQDNIKTNKVLEIIEDEMIEDKIVEEEDEVQIEKDEKCEEFYCTYDKFLNDTNTGVSNDTIWKLKDQMKKVASNIKEKMKEQSSLKVEKKKNLLDILTSRLPILDNNDIPSNEHKIIEEYNFENNINSSEDINEEDITTIRDNIKDDDEDIVKYNEDNKFNHIADKTKNLDDNEESENILNINLEEFIKENTNDCIEFEREVIKPFNDQRLIIVDNYEDQREYQKKKKKLEKIKEQKVKEQESKREKSQPRVRPKNKDLKEIKMIYNKKPSTAIASSQSKLNNNKEAGARKNSASKIKKTKENTTNNTNSPRIPIKITREESIAANKKVKNVNYNKLSNKKLIKSAISSVCLAGEPNRSCREKILEIIDKCPCENLIILFKGNFGRYDLKAVYTFNPQSDRIELLTCLSNSPVIITSNMIGSYYKFDLIQKDFKQLHETKEISVIVDAIYLTSKGV